MTVFFMNANDNKKTKCYSLMTLYNKGSKTMEIVDAYKMFKSVFLSMVTYSHWLGIDDIEKSGDLARYFDPKKIEEQAISLVNEIYGVTETSLKKDKFFKTLTDYEISREWNLFGPNGFRLAVIPEFERADYHAKGKGLASEADAVDVANANAEGVEGADEDAEEEEEEEEEDDDEEEEEDDQ